MEKNLITRATVDYFLRDQQGCSELGSSEISSVIIDRGSPSFNGWIGATIEADTEVLVCAIQGEVRLSQLLILSPGTDKLRLILPTDEKLIWSSSDDFLVALKEHEPYLLYDIAKDCVRSNNLLKTLTSKGLSCEEAINKIVSPDFLKVINDLTAEAPWAEILDMLFTCKIDLVEAGRLALSKASGSDIWHYAVDKTDYPRECKYCHKKDGLITQKVLGEMGLPFIITARESFGPNHAVYHYPQKVGGNIEGKRVLSFYQQELHDCNVVTLMANVQKIYGPKKLKHSILVHHTDMKKVGLHTHVQVYELDPIMLECGKTTIKVDSLTMDILVRCLNGIRRCYNSINLKTPFAEKNVVSIPAPYENVIDHLLSLRLPLIEQVVGLYGALCFRYAMPQSVFDDLKDLERNGGLSDRALWSYLCSPKAQKIFDIDEVRMFKLFMFGSLKGLKAFVPICEEYKGMITRFMPHHRYLQRSATDFGYSIRIKPREQKKVNEKQAKKEEVKPEPTKPVEAPPTKQLPALPPKIPSLRKAVQQINTSQTHIDVPVSLPIEDELAN